MTDLNDSLVDRCPQTIHYDVDDWTPLRSRKRVVPKIEEEEIQKKPRFSERRGYHGEAMTTELNFANLSVNDSIKSDIKFKIENTPGEYSIGYASDGGDPLVPAPISTVKSAVNTPGPCLLRFEEINNMPVSKAVALPPRTFTTVHNAFGICEENVQSLLIFLSNDDDLDTGLFSSLVAALLDKKTPLERRYLCHKIFSCLTNNEEYTSHSECQNEC